ncbi:hypothetical protein Deide_06111 [Deinococcus deserti VCD115]|uniref:Uncharacterized protein n=1 Tax=Deinococcus deserti (strain DSM 17065 / CIP 109153 / LMG 22923 / VCD115) TaxID=546414 RepID=C1D0T0_DEIDV|nr:hypothetical protein Deide_06111 [Deinococcus deserti VCD115]
MICLNVTGSGNETTAQLIQSPRMTLLFCSLEGAPLILRLHGQASAVCPGSKDWPALTETFPSPSGARQIYILNGDLVQTSCGLAVPYMTCQAERKIPTTCSAA